MDKVVFSTTLESADWANSRLISGNVAEEVAALKAQPGGTIADPLPAPGSSHGFVDLGFIDEFLIPVIILTLGRGTPLFHDREARLDLELPQPKAFGLRALCNVRYQVL